MTKKSDNQDELKRLVEGKEPDVRIRLQFTSLDNNNNKYWSAEWYESAGIAKREWGRVGSKGELLYEYTTLKKLRSIERSKIKDGYKEVQLHVPTPATVLPSITVVSKAITSKVDQVLSYIFKEAGESIQSYLSVSVDALSKDQIDQGRSLLKQVQDLATNQSSLPANKDNLKSLVQEYYRSIPTKLPHKIDADRVVANFCASFHEQETRLDQLEAGLAIHQAQASGAGYLLSLGAELEWLDPLSQEASLVRQSITNTISTHHNQYRGLAVLDVYKVVVPHERSRFESSRYGKSNVKLLFHGTRGSNVRHILKTGFRKPTTLANGWMFGPGIYFADMASKSIQYASSSYQVPRFLFLSQIAIGNMHVASDAHNYTQAPTGFDSVLGKKDHTRSWGGRLLHNEYIVYREDQVTIHYLATLKI